MSQDVRRLFGQLRSGEGRAQRQSDLLTNPTVDPRAKTPAVGVEAVVVPSVAARA